MDVECPPLSISAKSTASPPGGDSRGWWIRPAFSPVAISNISVSIPINWLARSIGPWSARRKSRPVADLLRQDPGRLEDFAHGKAV